MDSDSVCGSNLDQFMDDQLLNDMLAADSYENRVDHHHHVHDVQGHDHGDHLLGELSVLLDQELLLFNNNNNSSDCWSAAASEALSLGCGGDGPGASEVVSLPGEGSRSADHQLKTNHDHHHVQELHNQEVMENISNPIKQLSSCEIHLLPPESTDGENVVSLKRDEDEVQSESTANFQVPQIGMEFSSEDEAYKFYSDYAKRRGFRVRKGKVTWVQKEIKRTRFFYCSREGFKCKKDATNNAPKYHKKETRTGCEAMIKLTFDNGKCEISQFYDKHNHDLEDQHMLIEGSHMNASEDHKARTKAETEAEAEVESANCVEIHDKYGMTSFLHDEKTDCMQFVNGQSLINCFRDIQLEDPLFLHTVQVNDKNCLMNFFWTDGRSKIDYDCFGDVLVLDTTLIDAYNMIFATFSGINHHGKCVLFGGALLLDSSIASFEWLFRTFMEVMGGRQPKTVFTDWCPDWCQAMETAIEVVLPGTQHLLGIWYILQNATKYLLKYHGQSDFNSLFKKCIFDCESEEEFNSMWESLLEKHELRDDLWLKSLYVLRRKWSHFGSCESIFSAGLQSIQGHENVSKFLHNLTSEIKSSTPSDFVLHYLKIVEQQRKEELDEDFRSNESPPAIILRSSPMLKLAAKAYTCTMFRLFQEELLDCMCLGVEEISSDGVNSTFKLSDQESGTKEKVVQFNSLESSVTCSCKKYESVGILCVHALKVLNVKNIFRIPPQYILKRWTKSAKDGMSVDGQESDREVGDESMRHVGDESMRHVHTYKSKLMHKATNVITKSLAVDDDDHQQTNWMIIDNFLNMALKRVEEVSRTGNSTGHHSTRDASSANGTMKSQLKRKCENDQAVLVRQIKSKSSDGLKEGTKGHDQASRRAVTVSHSNCMEENSQQSVFRSSRPPLPSQSTFLQLRDHSKSSECWKERARCGMMTEKKMLMVRMEEMEKEILKLRNEQRKIVTSLNKP